MFNAPPSVLALLPVNVQLTKIPLPEAMETAPPYFPLLPVNVEFIKLPLPEAMETAPP